MAALRKYSTNRLGYIQDRNTFLGERGNLYTVMILSKLLTTWQVNVKKC
jgi:hypothetical protein